MGQILNLAQTRLSSNQPFVLALSMWLGLILVKETIVDGLESLVDASGQIQAVGKGTLRQALMLAGAEGTFNVVELRTAGWQELEGYAGLGQRGPGVLHGSMAVRGRVVQGHDLGWARAGGQGFQQKGLHVCTLHGSIGQHPGQGRGRSGARCMHMPDAGPVAG